MVCNIKYKNIICEITIWCKYIWCKNYWSWKDTTSIINSGKSLAYSFVAEKGASVNLSFQDSDGSRKVSKTVASAAGSAPDQVFLSQADLAALGTGAFSVQAQVTDVAGNTNTASSSFTIEAAPSAPKIAGIDLRGSRSGTLIQGDLLTAVVNFDQAVTVSDSAALTLKLDVGG